MLQLHAATPSAWAETVLADFPAFLQDHAACERKASATALAFVVRYPDRTELHDPMIALAREELEHFHQVVRLMQTRGVPLVADRKDTYVVGMLKHVRGGRDPRLMDRLLVAGIVEARGCERFGLIAQAHPEPEMAAFYQEITKSEARHQGLFVRLARAFFPEKEVASRLTELLAHEAAVIEQLPMTPALH
ncbi:MAG: tRNA-(ms[2]io[6]A)-hydroxylase [Nannocystaceae bacterium]